MTHPITRFLILACLAVLFFWFRPDPGPITISIQGKTMGTTYSIKARVEDVDSRELKESVEEELKGFDQLMSNWNPSSWVTAFNASPSTEWQKVDPKVLDILEQCADIHRSSEGAFDITLSPLIELWGFGARDRTAPPNPEQIQDALSRVDASAIEIDPSQGQVRKTKGQLSINCSALAKGYGVDLMTSILKTKGIQDYMVEIGGEVAVKGKPEGHPFWRIGVREPTFSGHSLHRVVALSHGAMATSGDYQNVRWEKGEPLSHIIDPRTGSPVRQALCSATIIAPDCSQADGLATACLVMGREKAMAWIQAMPHVEGLFIERLEDGQTQTFSTTGFPKEP